MKQKCFSTRAFPKRSRSAQRLLLRTLAHKPKRYPYPLLLFHYYIYPCSTEVKAAPYQWGLQLQLRSTRSRQKTVTMVWWIVFTDSGFWMYSWAHLVMPMTESCRWEMRCCLRSRRPRASTKDLRPCPSRTEISPGSLNLFDDVMHCR